MCPDSHILSVYFDGELPSPWKEKLEIHIEACPQCRADLERFKGCSQLLKAGTPNVEAPQERVWQKIRPLHTAIRGRRRLWRRSITIPLPAAAAAGAAICGILLFVALRPPAPAVPAGQDVVSGTGMMDVQGIVPVSNMNEVLQYLGSQDSPDLVIIRLPESRNFSASGEPAIIKAADYSRSVGSR
ncbi:MAG: hypothetical protein LBG90_09575 [Spirochaetaceae bacterium]|jgi:anti-sigma factor RsiW|nr:hypothetical protein [Spirochaetaceae bacterium]